MLIEAGSQQPPPAKNRHFKMVWRPRFRKHKLSIACVSMCLRCVRACAYVHKHSLQRQHTYVYTLFWFRVLYIYDSYQIKAVLQKSPQNLGSLQIITKFRRMCSFFDCTKQDSSEMVGMWIFDSGLFLFCSCMCARSRAGACVGVCVCTVCWRGFLMTVML